MPVRPATVDDVAAIAAVQVASWEGVYRGLMPNSVLDRENFERRSQQWSRYFANPASGRDLLVAESTGEVVGMASLGPNRDRDIPDHGVAEVYAIYVAPPAWGQGHGRDLMVATVESMRSLGNMLATLWVLDSNELGRRFYEGGGWVADDTTQVDLSFGEPMREVRYRLEL